jgi:DNA-binding IclR family transcriptional regulator
MPPAELRSGSWDGGARARLILLASPSLRQLRQKSEESAYLAVLAGDEIQYLSKELSVREVRYDGSLALRRPVYCTASGLVMLAAAGVDAARSVLSRVERIPHTPHTVTDLDDLMKCIGRIRRTGYAATYDGYIMGAAGVAAPVYGAAGEVVAALALGGPSSRFKAHRRKLARAVILQAEELSRRLSGVSTDDAG